ncbi:hypothetical protein BJX64DRAFT_263648 [Aspergillus heterothallicus]
MPSFPHLMNKTAEFAGQAANWTSSNPVLATSLFAGGLAFAAPSLVAVPALAAVGFGSSGVTTGSFRSFFPFSSRLGLRPSQSLY